MFQKLKNRNEGFTIIEVLIVLAIAGLIILIVFLAVPALQRNSRNTQRTNDASRISAAVNECINNSNGQTDGCGGADLDNLNDYINVGTATDFDATLEDNQQLSALTDSGAGGLNEAALIFDSKCNDDQSVSSGAGARAFVIVYEVETNSGSAPRCLSS